jgi:hypothetical protein
MMSQRLTLEEIRDFWRRQGLDHGQSPSASWSDHRVIEMEIRVPQTMKDRNSFKIPSFERDRSLARNVLYK